MVAFAFRPVVVGVVALHLVAVVAAFGFLKDLSGKVQLAHVLGEDVFRDEPQHIFHDAVAFDCGRLLLNCLFCEIP